MTVGTNPQEGSGVDIRRGKDNVETHRHSRSTSVKRNILIYVDVYFHILQFTPVDIY